MIITLPWPDRRLSPNNQRRLHWRAKAPVIKKAREDAAWFVLAAVPPSIRYAIAKGDDRIPITVRFYPPDKRHRDDDGMIGAFKHMRDGIADALHIDDGRFLPSYEFAEPEKPGRVEVEVKPQDLRKVQPEFPRSSPDAVNGLPPHEEAA